MTFRSADFESAASANSATPAGNCVAEIQLYYPAKSLSGPAISIFEGEPSFGTSPDPHPSNYPEQLSDTSFRSRVDQHDRRCAGANGPKAFRAADSVAAYPRRNDDFGPLYTSTKVGRDWN